MEKKLIKIPLQFFGEGEDDFDDEYFDDDVPENFGDDDFEDDDGDGADESDEDGDAAGEASEDAENGADEGSEESGDGGEEGAASNETDESELISELKALGYVGDDIKSLTADIKAKREGKKAGEESAERRAAAAEGKSHVRSGKPSRAASGDGTGGITERQVNSFAERTGCSKDEARRLLGKHARMMS